MSLTFAAVPAVDGDDETTVNWADVSGELSDSDMILLVLAGESDGSNYVRVCIVIEWGERQESAHPA
jgi:hypothetical protein